MPVFKKILDGYIELRSEIAVWETLLDHLQKNLGEGTSEMNDDDGRYIDSSIVQKVIKSIEDTILAPMRKGIDKYERLEVGDKLNAKPEGEKSNVIASTKGKAAGSTGAVRLKAPPGSATRVADGQSAKHGPGNRAQPAAGVAKPR